MINIIFGIKDYLKDLFHDIKEKYKKFKDKNYICDYSWLEGNLSHYICQRKFVRDFKKLKKKK